MGTLLAIALAILSAVPAMLVRFAGLNVPVEVATLFYGLAIVGASFAMAWGAEAAEHDIPRALALSVVALLAVFPEYAVDIVFAFKAGQNPDFAQYAAANMTGSNRLTREAVLPLSFLSIATLYSFILPLKASINLVDTLVLFALFAVYTVL